MLGDINRNLEPIEYELILCKPDKTQIGVLNVEDLSIDFRFPTTDELSFSIYLGENYYDLIKGDYLILLNEEKYFIIDNPEEVGDGIEVKNIHCYSLEYMLNKKNVRGYKLVSRKLYSPTNELDSNGFQLGVMNYVKTITAWKLDVNSFLEFDGLGSRYRSFDISEKSLFEFLITDVQEAYECIFLFDTLTKTISVKAISQLQGNKGFYLSEGNYIKSINKTIKNDEIKTRLYCYGNDISISGINQTGMPYIDNFTFYKHLDYMSQELLDALNAYESYLDSNSQVYADLLEDLTILEEQLTILDNNLKDSKTILTIAETNLDLGIKNSEDLTQLNINVTNATNDVSAKQLLVDIKQGEIDAKYVEISNYNDSVDINNYINTDTLVEEFDSFIKMETWEDNNYVLAEDLLEEGKKKLLKLSTPPLVFEIEVIDFLQIIECQHDWDKLVLGDIVSIEFSKFDVDIEVRLVSYSHQPSDNSLKLTFSNKDAIDDPFIYQADLIGNAITASNTLNYNKSSWDNKANYSVITELRNENIDTSLKQILASKNQDISIDGRGIWLTEKDDNGIISPEQMRIISNSIVFSNDNWQTASTSISPKGVNSATFWGKSIIVNEGLFDGIDIFDGGQTPVVEIGKYFDGVVEKKGIRINNGNFEITPSTEETSNGISLDKQNGLIISKTNNLTILTHRTILNATEGFKIQKNTSTFANPVWENVVYINADTGKLTLNSIVASGDIEASTLSATTQLKVGNIDILDIINNGLNAIANANTINGTAIKANTITATQINATNLHVSSANIDGSIVANSIVANASISGPTITGGNITGSTITSTDNFTIGGLNAVTANPTMIFDMMYHSLPSSEISSSPSNLGDSLNEYDTLRINVKGSTNNRGKLKIVGSSPANDLVDVSVIGDGSFSGNLSVTGNFSVIGTKACIVKTSQGWTNISAYETAEYYFGDIGRGEIIEGECKIEIDPLFRETVNTNIPYEVFLTPYGRGIIYVDLDSMTPNNFTVKGDDITFGYEIKAKRIGYETHRLEINKDMEEK